MHSIPCTTECAVRNEFVVRIVALDGDFIKWWCSPRPMSVDMDGSSELCRVRIRCAKRVSTS